MIVNILRLQRMLLNRAGRESRRVISDQPGKANASMLGGALLISYFGAGPLSPDA
jgi:hypothetical protein